MNVRNIVKLDKNNRVSIKGFRKYRGKGALVYIDAVDERSYLLTLVNTEDFRDLNFDGKLVKTIPDNEF